MSLEEITIRLESAQLAQLKKMVGTIVSQDNYGTAHPVYLVKEKELHFGIEASFKYDGYFWYDKKSGERIDDRDCLKDLECAEEVGLDELPTGQPLSDFEKRYYREVETFVQLFLTEEGAKAYIDSQRHNLKSPFIYVISAWRNPELQAIRALMFGLAGIPVYKE